MTHWLKEITAIAGVEGVLLASNEGILIDKIGTQLDPPKLEEITQRIMRIIAAYDSCKKFLKEFEFIWYDYHLLVMTSNEFAIIIFCGSTKALSLLRITINVVVAHILEDKKSMKEIKKYSADRKTVLKNDDLDQSEINLISKLQ
jgi:hypothetical protein